MRRPRLHRLYSCAACRQVVGEADASVEAKTPAHASYLGSVGLRALSRRPRHRTRTPSQLRAAQGALPAPSIGRDSATSVRAASRRTRKAACLTETPNPASARSRRSHPTPAGVSACVNEQVWALLVFEPVEHARGHEAAARFVCILKAQILEIDEDLVRIVGAFEHPLNPPRFGVRAQPGRPSTRCESQPFVVEDHRISCPPPDDSQAERASSPGPSACHRQREPSGPGLHQALSCQPRRVRGAAPCPSSRAFPGRRSDRGGRRRSADRAFFGLWRVRSVRRRSNR